MAGARARQGDPLGILLRGRNAALDEADRAGAARVRALLERSRRELKARLAALPQTLQDRFTAERMRATLAQVELALRTLSLGLRGYLREQTKALTERGLQDSANYLRAAERTFAGVTVPLALDRALLFDETVEGVQASLLRQHDASVANYGLRSVGAFERELMQSVLQQKSMDEAIQDLVRRDKFFEGRMGSAERIVRTETLYSYGRGALRGIQVTRERDWPDLRKVLVGFFDGREGKDTHVMDGQVRRPEEPFLWKAGPGFSIAGRAPFMNPPKRPNCRCVVVAWRSGWPKPATRNPLWGDVPPQGRRAA